MQTAATSTSTAAATVITPKEAKPLIMQKRIGSTTFLVEIRFSQTSKETLEEKILRMVESEALRSA